MTDIVRIHTAKDVATVRSDLETACKAHGFGVVGEHDLRGKLESKGVPLDFACHVVDVCNPHQAKKVLDANRAISSVLPCRVSLFESREGGTDLVMVPPSNLLQMFDEPSLAGVASEVEETLLAILRQAAE